MHTANTNKILEWIIHQQCLACPEHKGILSRANQDLEWGTPGHLPHQISQKYISGKSMGVPACGVLDLAKAFDTVSHDIFNMGFRRSMWKWFHHTDNKPLVNEYDSAQKQMNCVVPQGCMTLSIYTDDMALLCYGKNIHEICVKI